MKKILIILLLFPVIFIVGCGGKNTKIESGKIIEKIASENILVVDLNKNIFGKADLISVKVSYGVFEIVKVGYKLDLEITYKKEKRISWVILAAEENEI